METFWQDLRFGFRQLLSKPGFAAIATLALALGIGARRQVSGVRCQVSGVRFH